MQKIVLTQNQTRPMLDKSINHKSFLDYYWLKQELLIFCRNNKLLTIGSKSELTERISQFLKMGNKETCVNKSANRACDSSNGLTWDTKVINYKNDAVTSQFFKKHIGKHFHFNSYLRKFAKEKPMERLTYADLIKGYIAEEQLKKDSNYKTKIGTQFQYNQFIRDFFLHEKCKTQRDAINAWNLIKSKPCPSTYDSYKLFFINSKEMK